MSVPMASVHLEENDYVQIRGESGVYRIQSIIHKNAFLISLSGEHQRVCAVRNLQFVHPHRVTELDDRT